MRLGWQNDNLWSFRHNISEKVQDMAQVTINH